MRRAIKVRRSGDWTGPAAQSVTLAFDDRHRRRIRMIDDSGEPFMLDLPDAMLLADGDGLMLEDDSIIAVCAAAEPVADIDCGDAVTTARIAWHIGNRHTALQVLEGGHLRIKDDHVMVHMVEGLGARVTTLVAPFAPEGGAYDTGGGHGHDH